jgi:hypothetical protein
VDHAKLVTLAAHVLAAGALSPVEQQHLDQARQMQALSFTVHIPLVCFGIAFPSMGAVGRVAVPANR